MRLLAKYWLTRVLMKLVVWEKKSLALELRKTVTEV